MNLQALWKESIDTEEVIKDILPEAEENQIRSYLKKIGLVWEIFTVIYSDFTWNVIRNHSEIQDFIVAYNSKFKAKLTFNSFRQEGIKLVCSNQEARSWKLFQQFLETKDCQLRKVASFTLLKKSGGRHKDFCCRLPWQWNQRNFVITLAGVMYYTQPLKEIKEYIPFSSKTFKIFCGKEDTEYEFGIRLEATHRKLMLYTETPIIFFKFVYLVKDTLKKLTGPESHPFQSFAPTRELKHIQFLIDGEEYFQAVCQSLQKAEWQIMICGWWVSPEFYLKRPVDINSDKRLDEILQKAAHRGVKVFILVYNQSMFLTNDSTYTKEILESLSPNIKVLQHPLGVLPTFWSHHEKIVIIDQTEALIGGLDLCYGRFDTSSHLISQNDENWYPGIQYNNIRTRDLIKVRQFWKPSIDRSLPRLPWHDVAVKFVGQAVQDACHHFIEYWNYASFQTHYQDRYVLILDKEKKKPLMKRITDGISSKIQSIKNFAGGLRDRLFHSKDKEKEEKKKAQVESLREEEIKVVADNQMLQLQSQINSNKGMMKSKLQEKNGQTNKTSRSSMSSEEFKQRMLSYQTEHSERAFKTSTEDVRKKISQLDQIVEQMEDNTEKIDYIRDIRISTVAKLPIIEQQQQDFNCQMLRSVGSWSIGCDPRLKQQSIHNAYLSLIETSQNFIYIENQFFVSAVQGSPVVKNQIMNALFDRIVNAHKKKHSFRVIVVLPLVPGFAGELDDPDATIPRIIMHWQYLAISRSQNSLLSRLVSKGIDPDDYVSFFSLRTHGVMEGDQSYPATQIVYLHSKLMIVDDRKVIIGSANINDRSMRGSRDSELCLFVEGKALARVKLSNRVDDVSETIQKFRIRLWKEHFGEGINFQNPLDQVCIIQMQRRARNNTKIYRQIFHCYPDDSIQTFHELSHWRSMKTNTEGYYEQAKTIKGNVVQFPLMFLKEQNLLEGSTFLPNELAV